MMTRDLDPIEPVPADNWLGLAGDTLPTVRPFRPDLARGAGGHLTPAAALAPRTGVGMDPADPATWTRPYAPQPGMFTRLHVERGMR